MLDTTSQYSLFDTLLKGGWVMVPLGLCSLIALAIIIERLLWGPKQTNVIPEDFVDDIRELTKRGKYDEIIGLCRANKSPFSNLVLLAIKHIKKPRAEVRETIAAAGRREVYKLKRPIAILGTIAAISPLLGLLGTVFGMIETFQIINEHGVGNATLLSGGISEALLTTATGLTIAIPTMVFYRYFTQNIQALAVKMEQATIELLDEINTANEL